MIHELYLVSGSDSKESACSAGDPGLIPRLGRSPGGGNGNPFQCSCLGNPNGQRSLMGCSSWARKESGMIEWLNNDGSLFTPPPAPGTHPLYLLSL